MKMTLESFETTTEIDEKRLLEFMHGLGKWSQAVISGITLDTIAINKPIEPPLASVIAAAPPTKSVEPDDRKVIYVSGGEVWQNLYGSVVADGANGTWVNRRG